MEKFEKAVNGIKVVLGLLGILCYFIWMGVECVNTIRDMIANRTRTRREAAEAETKAYNTGWADAERVFGSKDEAEEI